MGPVPALHRDGPEGFVKLLGIVLIVLGIVGVAYGGFQWTRKDKVLDLGPVEVTTNKTETLPIPPVAGAVCLVVGAALIVAGRRID
jgi:uncharacterized membrane protein YidH (DUF202 family)